VTSAELLSLLQAHTGQAKGIHMDALEATTGAPARQLRHLISELREEGVPVCGKPETGYFLAETAYELDQFCIKYLEQRALHSLRISSRLRRIPLSVLAGQLALRVENESQLSF
jgi:predicted DNA-binding transcriptional regulator YafY